jgi:Mce-associated membrane protein
MRYSWILGTGPFPTPIDHDKLGEPETDVAVSTAAEAIEGLEPSPDSKAPATASVGMPERERRIRRSTIVVSALAVALVLALAGTGYLFTRLRVENAQEADRRDATQAARQLVRNLMMLDSNDAQASLGRVLALSTGDFREQLTSQSSGLQQVLGQAHVSSSGDVSEAGLVKLDRDDATVLVAARALVKNSELPNGTPRQYRMSVTLQRVSGQWLAANVEFVP